MKLQKFYILTAAALLFGAVTAQAQTTGFSSTTGPFDDLKHDCVAKEERGNQVLLLNSGDIVTQSFTACDQGVVEKAYVIVKQSSAHGTFEVEISDSRGEVIDFNKQHIKEGFSGLVMFKIQAKVDVGTKYNLKFKASNTNLVLEGQYGDTSENTLHLNGWKLDGHISTAVGIRHEIERPNPIVADRNPIQDNIIEDRATEFQANFSVYPNPFVDKVNLKFNRKFKGKTIVMLTDLSGNILHSEVIMNAETGQNLELRPAYNLHPGAYALRIVNEKRVYNQTLMKQ
jgi:hypothetical protein